MNETCDLQREGELQVCLHQAVRRNKVFIGPQSSFRALRETQGHQRHNKTYEMKSSDYRSALSRDAERETSFSELMNLHQSDLKNKAVAERLSWGVC